MTAIVNIPIFLSFGGAHSLSLSLCPYPFACTRSSVCISPLLRVSRAAREKGRKEKWRLVRRYNLLAARRTKSGTRLGPEKRRISFRARFYGIPDINVVNYRTRLRPFLPAIHLRGPIMKIYRVPGFGTAGNRAPLSVSFRRKPFYPANSPFLRLSVSDHAWKRGLRESRAMEMRDSKVV